MTFEEKFAQLPHTQQMQVHEANVRGTYLSIACDFERLMADLIAICEIDTIFPSGFNNLNDEDINSAIIAYMNKYIREITMGQKLDRSLKNLKKYNLNYFNEYNPCFKTLADLVQDRNLMAHGYSEYDVPQEKGKILIMFDNVYRGKKQEKLVEVKAYLSNLLTHRKSIMELMDLVVKIRTEVFGYRVVS